MYKIWYPHVPYQKLYVKLFEKEKIRIGKILGGLIIEHIGSTAVPGLGGKGYIDIYIVVNKNVLYKISNIIQEKLGYEYKEHASIANERLFHLKNTNNVRYHLHLTHKNNPDFVNAIKFRNYLKNNQIEALKYEHIKKIASKKANKELTKEDAKKAYMQTKEAFITKIIQNL